MSEEVQHITTGAASVLVLDDVMVTTRKPAYSGPTAVLEKLRASGEVALWGDSNDFPQRVVDDIRRYPLMAAVIDRKVNLLYGNGPRYGTVRYDDNGFEFMVPTRLPAVEDWMRKSNFKLFLREAIRSEYTYANVFVEYQMGPGHNYVTGLGCQDACHVRLGRQDLAGDIRTAYINDWRNAGLEGKTKMLALDPYYDVAGQLLKNKQTKSLLPVRDLGDDQFYYGITPWDGLRGNGWLDIATRVPELKGFILKHLMHLSLHVEIDSAYWEIQFPGYEKKTREDQIAIQTQVTKDINDWFKSGKGQGGAWMSTMISDRSGRTNDQRSLVKIHEKKGALSGVDGALLEDSQEVDFIFCRDMGLKPSLHGISPSKSGSSPGSGSEDRISRTNHILDQRIIQDKIMEVMYPVRDINGWPQDLEFWFGGYHAATLDRTTQVEAKPPANTSGN